LPRVTSTTNRDRDSFKLAWHNFSEEKKDAKIKRGELRKKKGRRGDGISK